MNHTIRNADLLRLISLAPRLLDEQERLLRESLALLGELHTAVQAGSVDQLTDVVSRQQQLAAQLERQRDVVGEFRRRAARRLGIDAESVCLSTLIEHTPEPERSRLQLRQREVRDLAESCRQAVEQMAGGIFSRLEFIDRLLANLQVGGTLRSYDSHGRVHSGSAATIYERQG